MVGNSETAQRAESEQEARPLYSREVREIVFALPSLLTIYILELIARQDVRVLANFQEKQRSTDMYENEFLFELVEEHRELFKKYIIPAVATVRKLGQ